MEDGQQLKIMRNTYQLIEIANCHGGDLEYLKDLLADLVEVPGHGIKFQPFKYSEIAHENFEYMSVYKELFFSAAQWVDIFKIVLEQNKDVWLDLFDLYGAQILAENINMIHGVKLQSSVLYNGKLIDFLSKLDLKDKVLMINIAGWKIEEIKELKLKFESIGAEKLILQIGFQNYPTKIEDSGLQKIKVLQENFPSTEIGFTEHLDRKSALSKTLAINAILLGASIIEKHVMHENLETKYDFYSSLKPSEYKEYICNVKNILKNFKNDFVVNDEQNYLKNTIQSPILNKNINQGDILNLKQQFDFKRSNYLDGLNAKQIHELQNDFSVFAEALNKGSIVKKGNFRKARIGSIIACRMKSTRLKSKAIQDVGGLSSIQLCVKNTLKVKNIDLVTLATSNLEADAVLKNHTYSPEVKFFQGHPDDVLSRFFNVAKQEQLDVIVRQTGDNMFIFDEIIQFALNSHFEIGADYTSTQGAPLGCDIEIFNTSALEKVVSHFKNASYSEYMTWYFVNNPDHFKINKIKLPSSLSRNYRLTLDYAEDYKLYKEIIKQIGGVDNVNLTKVYAFLDANPTLAQSNMNLQVKYQTDSSLIDRLNKETKI
jgi:N,N'-diacetyllegionaminate synthase